MKPEPLLKLMATIAAEVEAHGGWTGHAFSLAGTMVALIDREVREISDHSGDFDLMSGVASFYASLGQTDAFFDAFDRCLDLAGGNGAKVYRLSGHFYVLYASERDTDRSAALAARFRSKLTERYGEYYTENLLTKMEEVNMKLRS